MRKTAGIALFILLVALAAGCGGPKEKTVNILVDHDRWGEVAPCG